MVGCLSPDGITAIGCNMYDIMIVDSRRGLQASVKGLTKRGIAWLWLNMRARGTITIHKDTIDEFCKEVEKDGLTVQIR